MASAARAGATPLAVEADVPQDDLIAGEIIGPGVTCPQFRLDSGEQISLEGEGVRALVAGTRLQLTGRFVRISRCMQGRAFVVSATAPAAPE